MRGMIVFSLILIFGISSLFAAVEEETVAGKCMTCHKEKSIGLYNQWFQSKHAAHKVTCIECHQAKKGEPDAYLHEGAYIATLVTPKDCGRCHEKEAKEVQESHHATAGEILHSLDAYLAHVAGGEPVVVTGCQNCHGGVVEIDKKSPNKLSMKSFPNSGIGRINPDGSKGACNACHTRHAFDVAQARQPESCSKCHLGPDHPQKEIFEASKHGNAYFTHVDDMNLDADKWVVGEDYYEAPTCATCHQSATKDRPITHDVGDRLSWTLRPPVSKRKDNWKVKKENMMTVCTTCHSKNFADGHYYQFDATVRLYNDKFAKPATDIIKMVKELKLLESPAGFSNEIEWMYWELWHHEGRRARHGAAMMGPDYTWWHGIYDVAHTFYFKMLPEARKFNNAKVNAYIDNMIKTDPMHQWLLEPTKDLKEKIRSGKMQKIYEKMYKSTK